MARVIAAKSAKRAYPQMPFLIHHRTIHLVVGQRIRVFVVVLVGLEAFILDTTSPQAASLSREPEIAVHVFVDVYDHGIGFADTFKIVLRTVV